MAIVEAEVSRDGKIRITVECQIDDDTNLTMRAAKKLAAIPAHDVILLVVDVSDMNILAVRNAVIAELGTPPPPPPKDNDDIPF